MKILCPLCQAAQSELKYRLPGGIIVKCTVCHHQYTVPGNIDQFDDLYRDEVYRVVDNRDSLYTRIIRFEYSKIIHTIRKLHPAAKSLLDFGSGKGIFLADAKAQGYRVQGIETAVERAAFAKINYQVEVSTGHYSGGQVDGAPFDVITLLHVLEHLPEPKQTLADLLADNLTDDGLIVIEVPNILSWQAKLSGTKWMHLDIPRHLSHFARKDLVTLMNQLGYFVHKSSFFSWHLGVMGMCQSILCLLGYRGKIILDLKKYRINILLALALVFPLATVLEWIASVCSSGGILRIYCRKKFAHLPE